MTHLCGPLYLVLVPILLENKENFQLSGNMLYSRKVTTDAYQNRQNWFLNIE